MTHKVSGVSRQSRETLSPLSTMPAQNHDEGMSILDAVQSTRDYRPPTTRSSLLTHATSAIDKIFTATLDALAAIDIFSNSVTPTSFVVYAHDADDG